MATSQDGLAVIRDKIDEWYAVRAELRALEEAEHPGTSPGWTVWHTPSKLAAIPSVRYKRDAQRARDELMQLPIDWSAEKPVPFSHPARKAYEEIYRKYGLLRQQQLADNQYWPRPGRRD